MDEQRRNNEDVENGIIDDYVFKCNIRRDPQNFKIFNRFTKSKSKSKELAQSKKSKPARKHYPNLKKQWQVKTNQWKPKNQAGENPRGENDFFVDRKPLFA